MNWIACVGRISTGNHGFSHEINGNFLKTNWMMRKNNRKPPIFDGKKIDGKKHGFRLRWFFPTIDRGISEGFFCVWWILIGLTFGVFFGCARFSDFMGGIECGVAQWCYFRSSIAYCWYHILTWSNFYQKRHGIHWIIPILSPYITMLCLPT